MVHRRKRSHRRGRTQRRVRKMRGGSYTSPAPYGNAKNEMVHDNSKLAPLRQSAGMRKKRGGYLGGIVNQAAVPLVLLGMQQTYKKKGAKRHTQKYRR